MIDPAAFTGIGQSGVVTSASADLNTVMLENQRWLEALERGEAGPGPMQTRANEMPPVGIEGAGYIALDDGGTRLFARASTFHVASDGRLLDEKERAVVGFAAGANKPGGEQACPTALQVPMSDVHSERYQRFEIDERGIWWGVTVAAKPGRTVPRDHRVELGKVALALFQAPRALAPHGDGTLEASQASGAPQYFPSDTVHMGSFRRNPQQPSPEAMRANLRALWALSGRAEIEIAIAAGRDALARVALNLVR